MTADERKLLRFFRALADGERETLLAFAEFLEQRSAPKTEAVPSPLPLERPKHETVIGALKRLSATYPMLDKATLLNQASVLVSQHVMHGRAAVEVIDELEALFRRHYERLLASDDQSE
jgi:hypothetical protein